LKFDLSDRRRSSQRIDINGFIGITDGRNAVERLKKTMEFLSGSGFSLPGICSA
jgi:hypothetical protein